MVIIILIAYAVIGVVEIVPLARKKELRKLFVYTAFFAFALVISVLLGLGVKIKSPAVFIKALIYALTGQ